MARINNLFVFVESEDLAHDVESSSHPVEQGVDITDHIQRTPPEISISGKIVSYGDTKASDVLAQLKKMQLGGSLINYIGRNSCTNMQIQSFSTSHPNSVWGGCDFRMTLKEVRIAKPAYVAEQVNNGGTQQITQGENNNVYHTVKAGDCVWSLVITGAYKSYDPKYSKPMDKCNWVMEQNPDAFSRPGDFRTLQVGKRILVGYRK